MRGGISIIEEILSLKNKKDTLQATEFYLVAIATYLLAAAVILLASLGLTGGYEFGRTAYDTLQIVSVLALFIAILWYRDKDNIWLYCSIVIVAPISIFLFTADFGEIGELAVAAYLTWLPAKEQEITQYG